jgi:hypothetical protein
VKWKARERNNELLRLDDGEADDDELAEELAERNNLNICFITSLLFML